MTSQRIPLSVLDLAIVGSGRSSADALRETTALAQTAELLGYSRFWVAEHHNMPAVASTSPPVLAAHVAARTASIRVGSGGVMLPNHAPFVVAEQFAMLEALHPGRIDLGLGRAPGTDQVTAAALRRSASALGADDFPQHVVSLLSMLGHPAAPDAGDAPGGDARGGHPHSYRGGIGTMSIGLAPTPVPTSSPDIVLLGSSGFSAQLAGVLGLPFAFAHHFAGQNTVPAAELYRRSFRPSPALDAPYVIITAAAIAAETSAEAAWYAAPSELMKLSLRTGQLGQLHSPEEAARHPQRDVAASMPSTQVVGTPEEVAAGLRQLAEETQADELMISTITHGFTERARSLELLAEVWAVPRREAA